MKFLSAQYNQAHDITRQQKEEEEEEVVFHLMDSLKDYDSVTEKRLACHDTTTVGPV